MEVCPDWHSKAIHEGFDKGTQTQKRWNFKEAEERVCYHIVYFFVVI